MQKISANRFLDFCRSLEGMELLTIARRARFMVKVVDDGLVFIPASSNKPRKHTRSYVERMLEDFSNSSEPCKTSNYSSYTANPSCQIALMDRYTRARR